MSGEVVNLRLARKRRARDERRKQGDAAAARHGAGKAEKAVARFERERLDATLDGARRDDDRS